MHGFGSRLHDAMLVAGVEPEKLARRVGVSPATISRWLEAKTPDEGMVHLMKLRRVLKTRSVWLAEGEGPPTWISGNQHCTEACRILDGLSPRQQKEWLKFGERMTKVTERS